MIAKKGPNNLRYINEYNRENYDKITLLVPKGEKLQWKEAAAAAGKSLTAWVRDLVNAHTNKGG